MCACWLVYTFLWCAMMSAKSQIMLFSVRSFVVVAVVVVVVVVVVVASLWVRYVFVFLLITSLCV